MTHDERERDQRLLDAAAGLPRSIEPANDLWPGIEREIRENRVVRVDFRRRLGWFVAVGLGLVPALAEANFPPIPKASATATEVLVGEPVAFSSTETIDPDQGRKRA